MHRRTRPNTLLTLILLAASSATAVASEPFVGSLQIGGRAYLWEGSLDFDSSQTVQGAGTLRAPVPMGFDAPIADSDLEGTRSSEGQVELRLATPWTEVELRGQLDESELVARGRDGALRLWRAAPDDEEQSRLVGLWTSGNREALLTWREGGGLRWIDLATGRAESWRRLEAGWHSVAPGMTGGPVPIVLEKTQNPIRLSRGASEPWRRSAELRQERIRFRSAGGELAGTVLRPAEEGRYSGVVLVHGSGPIYRTALAERAVALAQRGFAALIYDKRGTGDSEGSWRDAGNHDLALDARAAFEVLRAHPDVRTDAVGFYGQSEAGWVIPHAASGEPSPAFVIVGSGGGATAAETELYQKGLEVRRRFDEASAAELEDFLRRVLAWGAGEEVDREDLERRWQAAMAEPWFEVTDLPRFERLPEWSEATPEMLAWRRELQESPSDVIAQMECPTLVLFGERDVRVPTAAAIASWRDGAERSGAPLRVEILPGADHGLRVEKGDERMLHPELFDRMASWLQEVLAAEGGTGDRAESTAER